MPVQSEIENEILELVRQMEGQKLLIERSIGNALVFEAAEAELKALHSRLR